jgi:DNA polymerase (family 10)
MENREIAAVLALIGLYKELAGENVFKVRAFENAARTVELAPESVTLLFQSGRLRDLKGIGEALADVIGELVTSGRSNELEQLQQTIPASLLELLSLQGLGPKKVRAVWQQLGITTIGELEYACRENRLVALDGFGTKTQEKILAAIEFKRSSSGIFLYSEARLIAEDIKLTLGKIGLFTRVEIAGSLRRGKDVVKDADILLIIKTAAPLDRIRETLLDLADKTDQDAGTQADVIGQGDTKISLRHAGLQIDFRIIEEKSFACAWQYFTGSKEHNTALRSRAKTIGCKVNEYEIEGPEGSLFPENEEDLYCSLGLDWIPPELREGEEEIDAALAHRLPVLISEAEIKGLIHVHSTWSDGFLPIEELIRESIKHNYSYLCLSDHSRSAGYAGGLSVERLAAQAAEIDALNDKYTPFRVFHGIESDILSDGSLDYPDDVLASLDFVIGAIHSKLKMEKAEATDRLLGAIANPYLTILAHPSGRLLLSREGYSYDTEAILAALAQHHVVLEHNCKPSRLDPDWHTLKRAAAAGIMISINPDLHSIEDFADMTLGLIMARKAWLGPGHLLNCKTKEEIDEFFRQRHERARP